MSPEWSADGKWIAFVEQHEDGQRQGAYSYVGVRAVRIDGTGEHEVFAAPVVDGQSAPDMPVTFATEGSPALLTLTQDPQPREAGGLPTALIASSIRDLSEAPWPLILHRDYLALSPDGLHLAVTTGVHLLGLALDPGSGSSIRPVDGQDNKSLAIMDLASGDATVLTDSATVAVSPSWSPDGHTIAYVSRPDTGPVPVTDPGIEAERPRRIWTVSAAGGAARPLVTEGADCRQERPLWAADGNQVVFACLDAGQEASLWTVPAAGGKATMVVADVSPNRLAMPLLAGFRGHIDWEYLYDWWRPR